MIFEFFSSLEKSSVCGFMILVNDVMRDGGCYSCERSECALQGT